MFTLQRIYQMGRWVDICVYNIFCVSCSTFITSCSLKTSDKCKWSLNNNYHILELQQRCSHIAENILYITSCTVVLWYSTVTLNKCKL